MYTLLVIRPNKMKMKLSLFMIFVTGTLLVLAKPLPQAGQGSTLGKGAATTSDLNVSQKCAEECKLQNSKGVLEWLPCVGNCEERMTGAQG